MLLMYLEFQIHNIDFNQNHHVPCFVTISWQGLSIHPDWYSAIPTLQQSDQLFTTENSVNVQSSDENN